MKDQINEDRKIKSVAAANEVANEDGIGTHLAPPPYKVGASSGEKKLENDKTDENASNYFIFDNSGSLTITLGKEASSKTNSKTLTKTIPQIRDWITEQYNWNSIVQIVKYAASKNTNFTYTVPTNLAGTSADASLIIPDDAIKAIISVQLDKKLEKTDLKESNYAEILKAVDGLPGSSFVKEIMKETSKSALLNEESNTSMKDTDGNDIEIPNMDSDETTLYNFFRNITLARNGLWSDKENITNITGLRRKLETDVTEWNDTIAVCWTSKEGDTVTKHAKVYAGTTEPGEISNHRQMTPQTSTMHLGYHKGRQPAGRLSQIQVQGKNNSSSTNFYKDDSRGFNVHPGGSTAKTKGMMSGAIAYGKSVEGNSFSINVLMTESFKILSEWGLDPTKTAYEQIKAWKDVVLLDYKGKSDDGKSVSFDKGTGEDKTTTTRDIAASKKWLVDYWFAQKDGRNNLVKILKDVDANFSEPDKLNSISKKDFVALITDDAVENIVKKQIDYSNEAKHVDAKAGSGFLDIIDGKKEKTTTLKTKATAAHTRLEQIFKSLKDDYKVKDEKINYLKGLKPNTKGERKTYDTKTTKLTSENNTTEVNENVGGWSEGCQVVFGPEKFYEMWHHLTNKTEDSDQRLWYYTLIDLSKKETKTKTSSGAGTVSN